MLAELDANIERRFQEATVYMDQVVANARRIVFRGKER